MKQIASMMAVLAVTGILMFGCGSTPGNDAADVIKQHADVTEQFVNKLEAAHSAQDVAEAVDAYTAGMQKLVPLIQDLSEKYPGYKDGKVPKELEKEAERLEELSVRMPAAMMKTASYMMDPVVQKAMENMSNEMAKIGQ
jgi:methionyl-tRNA synthetase